MYGRLDVVFVLDFSDFSSTHGTQHTLTPTRRQTNAHTQRRSNTQKHTHTHTFADTRTNASAHERALQLVYTHARRHDVRTHLNVKNKKFICILQSATSVKNITLLSAHYHIKVPWMITMSKAKVNSLTNF